MIFTIATFPLGKIQVSRDEEMTVTFVQGVLSMVTVEPFTKLEPEIVTVTVPSALGLVDTPFTEGAGAPPGEMPIPHPTRINNNIFPQIVVTGFPVTHHKAFRAIPQRNMAVENNAGGLNPFQYDSII